MSQDQSTDRRYASVNVGVDEQGDVAMVDVTPLTEEWEAAREALVETARADWDEDIDPALLGAPARSHWKWLGEEGGDQVQCSDADPDRRGEWWMFYCYGEAVRHGA